MRPASVECRGGRRTPPREIAGDGWRRHGILVVDETDPALTWAEKELVRNLGDKLYGKRPAARPTNANAAEGAR